MLSECFDVYNAAHLNVRNERKIDFEMMYGFGFDYINQNFINPFAAMRKNPKHEKQFKRSGCNPSTQYKAINLRFH